MLTHDTQPHHVFGMRKHSLTISTTQSSFRTKRLIAAAMGRHGGLDGQRSRSGSLPDHKPIKARALGASKLAENNGRSSKRNSLGRKWMRLLRKSTAFNNNVMSTWQLPNNAGHVARSKRSVHYNQHRVPFIGKENELELTEECIDDVIYNVKLKKVTQALQSPQSDGLVTKTRKVFYIKAATLEHLTMRLCRFYLDEQDQDAMHTEKNFATVMLETYRSYATPDELLDTFIAENGRINTEKAEADQPRRRKLNRAMEKVIRTWTERYFKIDFYSPSDGHPLLVKLERFADTRTSAPECADFEELYARQMFLQHAQRKLKEARELAQEEGEEQDRRFRVNGSMSPSHGAHPFADIHDETENIRLDHHDDSNYAACRRLLTEFHPEAIAEQLTIKDAKLFLAVTPCMALEASREMPNKPTVVQATIVQFNLVVYSVLTTCLCPDIKASQRTKVLCKWIEIANFCREQRNFNSLHAIVSSLQTQPIYRLKKLWMSVPGTHKSLLDELKAINTKDLIRKVGTTKTCTTEVGSTASRFLRKDVSRKHQTMDTMQIYGTIPYLGHIFHDLIYIHCAFPDKRDGGRVNFEKCRKEFEHLAQLQLWQVSCKGYQNSENDPQFTTWFQSISHINDKEASDLSLIIEPDVPKIDKDSEVRRNSSLSSAIISTGDTLRSSIDAAASSSVSSRSSVTSLGNVNDESRNEQDGNKRINVQLVTRDTAQSENKKKETKLDPNHRTNSVIRELLTLFELDPSSPGLYSLNQIFPTGKVLTIPDDQNVFYAMNSSEKEFNFVLLEKGVELKQTDVSASSTPVSTPSTPVSTPPPKSLTNNGKKHHHRVMSSSSIITSVAKSPIRTIINTITSSGSYSFHDDSPISNISSSRRSAVSPQEDKSTVSLLQVSPSGKKDHEEGGGSRGWGRKVRDLVHSGQKTPKRSSHSSTESRDISRGGSKTLPRLSPNESKSWRKYSPKFMRKTHQSLSEYESTNNGEKSASRSPLAENPSPKEDASAENMKELATKVSNQLQQLSLQLNNDTSSTGASSDDDVTTNRATSSSPRRRAAAFRRQGSMWTSDPCILDSVESGEQAPAAARPISQISVDEVPIIVIERESFRRKARRSRGGGDEDNESQRYSYPTVEDEDVVTRL